MNVYLDASAQVRMLTQDGPSIEGASEWLRMYCSTVARVETRRTIDRLRLTGVATDDWVAAARSQLAAIELQMSWLPVLPIVIERAAESIGVVMSALDAMHVASAVIIRAREVPDLIFATHDRQQAIGARAMGFEVVGVTF
jgi:predicted nucleic acid-binding protein